MFKDEEFFTIKDLSQILNVHQVTIRNWEREGKSPIPVHRTTGNQRRYLGKDLNQYLGLKSSSENDVLNAGLKKKTVLYARVSSHDQKKDLETQVQLLSLYASAKGYKYEVLSEVLSGLNFKRPKFQKLIDMIEKGEVARVIINHKDRLMRFGYELFEKICLHHGVEILILDNTEKELERELMEDFIALITSFSGKIYGKRSHKNKQLIQVLENTEV